MLDKLRVQQRPAAQIPPHPAKIQPGISVADFRKFTPRVLQKPTVGYVVPRFPLHASQVAAPGAKPQLPLVPPVVNIIPRPPAKQIPRTPPHQIIAPPQKVNIIPAQGAQPQIPRVNPTVVQRISNPIRKQPVIAQMPSPIIREAGLGSIPDLRNIGSNRILVMIAAGPSVKEIDFTPIKEHTKVDFMCVNQPCEAVWPSKYWAFCDHTQYRRNQKIWDTYDGVVINSANVQARRRKQFIIGNRPGKGFSLDSTKGYHIGRSSTYANMQVAFFMGYKRIFICGIDMTDVKGVMHYYGQNPDVTNERRKERFSAEADSYNWAGNNLPPDIKERFVFCSSYNPWPFMNLFPRLDHKMMVDEVKKLADSLL